MLAPHDTNALGNNATLRAPSPVAHADDRAAGGVHDRWDRVSAGLPANLAGCRVLDVGSGTGAQSIELARRGANVTACDSDGQRLLEMRWASRQGGMSGRVELRRCHVYALAREREQFDLVLMLDVLDGLRYPQLALDILRRVTRRTLIVGTRCSATGLEAMAAVAGFAVTDSPAAETWTLAPLIDEARWSSAARESELFAVIGDDPFAPDFA